MKTAVKTALGVDITQTYISMALLRKDSKGIKLIKAARCPVPEGTIKNGQVQEPAVLLKVLRELKSRNKIRSETQLCLCRLIL